MLRISFRFDKDFDLSARDPFGDFTIFDGSKELQVKNEFIDFCFAALVDGCKRLSTAKQVRESLGEAEFPLVIETMPGGDIRISFGNQTVRADTLEALEAAVRGATESFLDFIKNLPDFDENDFPRLLQQYSDWKHE